jgi:DNA polymerase-4
MHIDMDAFFASVEIARNPQLHGLPVAVGGPGSRRGVIAAASYEVRKYGVYSAMPIFQARALCPNMVLVKPDFHEYSRVSRKIIEILRSFTPDVEPLSPDECFVGLTGLKKLWGTEENLARLMKQKISKYCNGITCSIGIGPSRVTAKAASDFQKPDGVTIIHDAPSFLRELSLDDIPGIGRKTSSKLIRSGLESITAIQKASKKTLVQLFGRSHGSFLFNAVRGADSNDVRSISQLPKSISRSETLLENTINQHVMLTVLAGMCDETTSELLWHGLHAKTVSATLRYSNFETVTRHRSFPDVLSSPRKIFPYVRELLATILIPRRSVRMVGMGLSNFSQQEATLSLFNFTENQKEERLMRSIQTVRGEYGESAIWWGSKEIAQ